MDAVPSIRGATAIARQGLENQICAIVRGGRVNCWSQRSSRPDILTRRAIPGIRGAVLLTVGSEVGCTLDARRRLRCWNMGPAGPRAGIPEAIDVACADAECCAVLPDGNVSCWSEDYYVDGCSDCGHTDSPLAPVEDLSDITSIVSDGESFCARRSSGRVDCWRSAASGHSGLRPADPRVEVEDAASFASIRPGVGIGTDGRVRFIGAATPPEAASVEGAVEVSDASCARLADGRVQCWGEARNYAADAFVSPEPSDSP